ncbi:MAG TPA: N-acetyltransferase [Planctomycetaceae bacterium]|nr:N-acetyltransferase [Planctomycetaceae bacterium]
MATEAAGEGDQYVLRTPRLGLRTWQSCDINPFARMNADAQVMKYFPRLMSTAESQALVTRLNAHFEAHGFTYFAVDELSSGSFIGFVGLKVQLFAHPISPLVDCGWRLAPEYWGAGFATEAASAVVNWGFHKFRFAKIHSLAPRVNQPSIAVMQRIGLEFESEFEHPLLSDCPHLQPCVLYSIHCTGAG